MIYAQAMFEYGAITAAIANAVSGLLGFDVSWNAILIVGGFIIFFWYIVFKH